MTSKSCNAIEPAVVEDLTEVVTLDGRPAIALTWTMSTFVPYRVLLMRTLVQFDPPRQFVASRLRGLDIVERLTLRHNPDFALSECADLAQCCVNPSCVCPTVLCGPE